MVGALEPLPARVERIGPVKGIEGQGEW